MALTLKDYLDRPLDDYCSEILSEWRNNCINQASFDIPITSRLQARELLYSRTYVQSCTLVRVYRVAVCACVGCFAVYSQLDCTNGAGGVITHLTFAYTLGPAS